MVAEEINMDRDTVLPAVNAAVDHSSKKKKKSLDNKLPFVSIRTGKMQHCLGKKMVK